MLKEAIKLIQEAQTEPKDRAEVQCKCGVIWRLGLMEKKRIITLDAMQKNVN